MKTVINRGNIAGFISGILIALLIIGTTAFNVFGRADESKPLKIGLINMVEVFDNSKKRQEYTERLEKEKEKKHREIKEIENEMIKIKKEIEEFDKVGIQPDSPLRTERELKIKVLSLTMDSMVKSWNRHIKIKVNEQTGILYNEIREVINKYAQTHGFDLILKTDPPRLEKDPEESATLRINTRAVLYYEESMDITDEIIKVFNKE